MDPSNPGGPKYPVRVKYEYVRSGELPIYYTHGVWGGINPHGEIEMNLYIEGDKLPSHSERSINPDGSVGPEELPLENDSKIIVRQFHAKMVLSYQTAKAIIEWLEEKVQVMELEGGHTSFLMDDDKGPAQ